MFWICFGFIFICAIGIANSIMHENQINNKRKKYKKDY